jgi:PAS domain S-box-containing protein
MKYVKPEFKYHDHVSLFYSTTEEQLSVVLHFVKAGLELGEKCVYLFYENRRDFILESLEKKGVAVDSVLRNGDLLLLDCKEVYLAGDFFDPDHVIKKLKHFSEHAVSGGYDGLRITGEMSWANGEYPGLERLMEYEARLNSLIPRNNITALCQYNMSSLPSGLLIHAIKTHPRIIYKNSMCENGYYVPPCECLQKNNADLEIKRMLNGILKTKESENGIPDGAKAETFKNRLLNHRVNEWEKTLEVFKESESYFRNLVNSAPVALIMTDTSGRCLFANEYWQMLSGLSLQESIGSGWQKAIHPEDVGVIGSWWYPGEKKRGDPGTGCRIYSVGGAIKWINLKSAPLYGDKGSMIGFIAAFSEIPHDKEKGYTLIEEIADLRSSVGS